MIKYRHKETGLFLTRKKLGYISGYSLTKKGTVWLKDCLKTLSLRKDINGPTSYFKPEEFELVEFSIHPIDQTTLLFTDRLRAFYFLAVDPFKAHPNLDDASKLLSVSEGFHSFPFKKDAEDELCIGRILSQFVIPKGSQYIEGFWEGTSTPNIVSNQIIRIGCWPFDWFYKRKNKVVTYSEYKQLEAQNE